MKKIYLSLLLLLTSVVSIYASHIAGGDLRVVFRSQSAAGPIYRIVANIYHDPTGISLPPSYTLSIFRKRDNFEITAPIGAMPSTRITVTLRSYVLARYPTDNPICQAIASQTGIYLYDREVVLDPAIYNDPQGYYITQEDCCRNGTITNGFANGSFAFYTEFPRVTNAALAPFTVADAFINSTPDFRILQTAYLCLNQPFTNDFSATDPDGDVLTYDIVTPLATALTPLTFGPGYSLENAFGSLSPAGYLRINANTGILSVTPGVVGLFAFGVRCTETRNGIKIGESRREFQYSVRGDCAPAIAPIAQLPPGNIVGGAYVLDLNNGPSIDITITGSKGKTISGIDIVPVSANFTRQDLEVSKIFSPAPPNIIINPVTGQGKTKLTWPPCLYSKNATDIYEFDLIITDNSCPVSNVATARLKIKILQRNNPAPKWEVINTRNIAIIDQRGTITRTPDQQAPTEISITTIPVLAGGKDSVKFTVVGRDLGDSLRIRVRAASDGATFSLSEKKLKVTKPYVSKDVVFSDFVWVPTCELLRKNGRREEFAVEIIVEERSSCERLTSVLKAKFILEDNGVTDDYQPINVFTPNGDGKNDEYTLPLLRNATCLYKFKNIVIHNRYGKEVFQSNNESFAWKAKDYPTGLYYYRIEYDEYEYKGSLQVLR